MWANIKAGLHNFWVWLTGPSVKRWLKAAFTIITKILGSPQAIQLYVPLIAAAIGLTVPEVTALWAIIMGICRKAEATGATGDEKYAMATEEFKKVSATPLTTFQFDYILHNCVAQINKEEEIAKKTGKAWKP